MGGGISRLRDAAVAYLNVDTAVSGPRPYLIATPDLYQSPKDMLEKIAYPFQDIYQGTLYDAWNEVLGGEILPMGPGSDYTPFVHNGISALEIGSINGPADPIYHARSNYDSYHWMRTFGDPDFLEHKTVGQFLTLLAYNMSSSHIIPINVEECGIQMTRYFVGLDETLQSVNVSLDLLPLERAIAQFNTSASALVSHIASRLAKDRVKSINAKLRDFSRAFVSQGDLPRRDFYKHVIFALGIELLYGATLWPGISDAVTLGNLTFAQEWVTKSANAVERAAGILMP